MAINAAAPMIWRISISFLMLFQSERLPDRATTVILVIIELLALASYGHAARNR
jgi:hypothetical protein